MMDDHARYGFRISREQARSIAEAYLRLPTTNLGGTRVRDVYHMDEIDWRSPSTTAGASSPSAGSRTSIDRSPA